MPFEKGISGNPKGRQKGSENKLTKTVKETVLAVLHEMQDDPKVNLLAFGKSNPTEFYKIASKLIPTEVKAQVEVSGVKSILIEPASKAKS